MEVSEKFEWPAPLNEGPGTHDHAFCLHTGAKFTTQFILRVNVIRMYAHCATRNIADLSSEFYLDSLWQYALHVSEIYTLRSLFECYIYRLFVVCFPPCPQVTFLHPGGVSLEWTQCANLPVKLNQAQAVLLKTKVYVQGCTPLAKTDYYIYYMYEVTTGVVWVYMKSPTKWSALTIYRLQLVLVGGREPTGRVTNQLWVLQDEQTWTQPLPPMPTARASASAISSGDHLVVAGGLQVSGSLSNLVEVYDGLQWVRADPLPVACCDIKSTYQSGMWYLMGGIGQSTSVFYTSLHSLIEKATQQPPHSPNSSEQQSVWKTLPDVPYEYSSTTTLGGALLALGGEDSESERTSSVHMYSPITRSWLHIGDIPEAVDSTCSITLTIGEVMVIGGWTGSDSSLHVHKVCMKLQ